MSGISRSKLPQRCVRLRSVAVGCSYDRDAFFVPHVDLPGLPAAAPVFHRAFQVLHLPDTLAAATGPTASWRRAGPQAARPGWRGGGRD